MSKPLSFSDIYTWPKQKLLMISLDIMSFSNRNHFSVQSQRKGSDCQIFNKYSNGVHILTSEQKDSIVFSVRADNRTTSKTDENIYPLQDK